MSRDELQYSDLIQIRNRLFDRAAALLIGFGFAALAYAVSNSWLIFFICFPLFVPLAFHILASKERLRNRIRKKKFPAYWRYLLEQYSPLYQQLPYRHKEEFEKAILVFLAEQKMRGIGSVIVTDETRILVAISAVSLIFHRPDWDYTNLREILLYESSFDLESYMPAANKPIAGLVSKQHPVILSQEHLFEGFRIIGDGLNVGYHEFAHVIDLHDVGSVERPLHSLLGESLIQSEIGLIEEGLSSIRSYGATNEAEFFAVITEYFFDNPSSLFVNHPELFIALSRLYHFDPLQGDSHTVH